MYYRCCVPNCKSIRQEVKLHQIPVGNVGESRKLWVKAIVAVSPNITDQIYTEELHKLFICHKHFERRFISEKNRVLINGYPSLFTEEEIASGVPSKVDPEVAARDSARAVVRDHGCTRRFHVDHTYAKINDEDQWMEQLIVSGIPGTQRTLEKCIDVNHAKDTQIKAAPEIESNMLEQQLKSQGLSDKKISQSHKRKRTHSCSEPVPEVEEAYDPDYELHISPSPLPEVEDSGGEAVFSWQREEELIEADDPSETPAPAPSPPAGPTLALFCEPDPHPGDPNDPRDPKSSADHGPELDPDPDVVFYPQSDQTVPSLPAPVDNRCKDCGEVNEGFEFWCVQCAGGALCGACAGRAPHLAHYVLRAPMGCPRARTQMVLTMIRQQLQNQNQSQDGTVDDDLKLEMKEEPAEVPPAEFSAAEPDPLACESHEPIPLDDPLEPEFPHDLIEPLEPVSLCSPISLHSPRSSSRWPHSPTSCPASTPEPAGTPEPATHDADKSIEEIVEHNETLQPPRLRKPTDAHEEILIPTQRKLVKVSPAEVKRAFLSHIERVVSTQNKQLKVYQPHVKPIPEVRDNVLITQDEGPTCEGNSRTTRLQARGQATMKVTSEPLPSEIVTIDLDVADETIEYLEEGLESDIETIDDVDNQGDDVLDEDDLSDEQRIVRNVPGRGVKRKKDAEETLPVKGPSELMVRALPSKAVIKVRPLSSLEIRNWTAVKRRLK